MNAIEALKVARDALEKIAGNSSGFQDGRIAKYALSATAVIAPVAASIAGDTFNDLIISATDQKTVTDFIDQHCAAQVAQALEARPVTVTLGCSQLREALDFIIPDRDIDPTQWEYDITFGIVQHSDDDGIVTRDMCCWNDDTDGVLPLIDEYNPVTARESCRAEALAMDLQFDIDLASALVHAQDAQDAARWRVMMICADQPDSPEAAALDHVQDINDTESKNSLSAADMIAMADEVIAAVAAMKANDEN